MESDFLSNSLNHSEISSGFCQEESMLIVSEFTASRRQECWPNWYKH